MPAQPKTTKTSVTPDEELRLAAVGLVMEWGTTQDRARPEAKAERIFQYLKTGVVPVETTGQP